MLAVERSSDEEPPQISDTIIGGVAAVVIALIAGITIAVITITFLVLRKGRGDVSLKKYSDTKYDCVGMDTFTDIHYQYCPKHL